MFGHLKKLLRRLVETPGEDQPAPAPDAGAGSSRRIVIAPRLETAPPHKNGGHQNGRGIELPLQPILSGLPLELQPRLLQPDAGTLTISIPLEKILAQLSRGAVQITFGELRQAAPDLFTQADDRDRVLVPLPLGEVLSRLNPALITRRRVQKQAESPAEICSPFDQRNQSLIFSVGPANPESAPTSASIPPSRYVVPAPVPVMPPSRSGITFTPTPPPPAAVPIKAPTMSSAPRARGPSNGQSCAPASAPTVQPPPPATPIGKSNPLLVSLISLAESWPEAVRQELVQLNLVDAKVALPTEIVEQALRQGRVALTWKTLRSWIKPAPLPTVSAHDSSVLELPLKVVAPPFLARQKETAKFRKKVSVDDEIPNLFFGFPQSESGSAVVASPSSTGAAKPVDTNFYIWEDSSEQLRVPDDAKVGPSPGTKFVAKYATPNEIVSRASALDGVAGALIALPDGLMVASRLSPDLNGDTLAAFLPQIFAKVNQCTKELRMGELNNVNFTVGNVPWKIFRVNAIFFATFGRAGEPLPTAQLAALAVELDHRPK